MAGMRFEFGWRNYFHFTFSFGTLPEAVFTNQDHKPNTSAATGLTPSFDAISATDIQNACESCFRTESGPKPKASQKTPCLDGTEAVKHCILFRLPVEVRNMIYGSLLVSPDPIENPAHLLTEMRAFFLNARCKMPDIDGAITQTCRLIHLESNNVLYGRNVFIFDAADQVRQFGAHTVISMVHDPRSCKSIPFINLGI